MADVNMAVGANTSIAGADRAVAFGLDGGTHTHTEDGKFIIYGDLEVTGTATIDSGISDELDGLGV